MPEPLFDPQILIDGMGFRPDEVPLVLAQFLDHARTGMTRLERLIQTGDWPATAELAHSLKGCSQAVGAVRLGAVLDRLERACQTRTADIPDLVQSLGQTLADLAALAADEAGGRG